MKYLRFRNSEFVTKTQFLCKFAKIAVIFFCKIQIFSKNLTTERGLKERFSLLQEKYSQIQAWCLRSSGSSYKSPGLDLKGGLLVFRKSQKISTASDQYVLSYVKNNYRGGGWIWPPHPSRIRVNKEEFIYCAERVNAIITPKYLG